MLKIIQNYGKVAAMGIQSVITIDLNITLRIQVV